VSRLQPCASQVARKRGENDIADEAIARQQQLEEEEGSCAC
jgi:hypothetical protein